ncbi:thiol reductant ABC exporter subunit CydD [Rheinheimera sp. F8]|uniref:thiol reductant ABC exporter subunit CydD n=1 Tax=Rheinheimera sp. F8 TaxID=1763998 RepID=UPI001AD807EC|nr:thiol reductant ABC exporter subunit CydD [Rheinheimera sp. F8]
MRKRTRALNKPVLNNARPLLQQWLQPYRPKLLLAVFAAALSVPLLLWQMWCLALLADAMLAAALPAGTLLTDRPAPEFPFVLLWQFALAFLLRQLCLLLRDLLTQQSSRLLRTDLRQQLLNKLAAQGPARQRFGSDGLLSTLLTEQIDALDGYISRYWPQLFQVIWTPLLIAVVVCWHSPLAGLLLLLTAPLVPLFMVLVGREASKASSEKLAELGRMGARLWQFLQGLSLLRRLNAIPQATAQLEHATERYRQSSLQVLRLAFLSTAVLELFASLAIALVALYLGLGLLGELPWAKGGVPVAFAPAFFILLLAPEFYQPLRQLGTDYHAKAQAEAAALALKPLWLLPSLPMQPAGKPAQDSLPTVCSPSENTPLLQLQQIRLGSEAQPRLLIPQLQIKAGERLLLQGDSGSGKSSFLQLLAGFADFSGDYWFAGKPVDTANRPMLWSQLSYLTQTPELFAGTVAENLRMALPGATDAALTAALQQVGLLAELGVATALDYSLGEAGQGLSGGQQQRLCLARLLLADRPLWLLDEPFAELDQDTAAGLAVLLAQLSLGRTLLIASHQWQQLSFLDGALLLQQGQIIGRQPLGVVG